MPQRWLHNLIDIIAHGKYLGEGYWKYHQWKDDPWRELGTKHRKVRHGDFKQIIQELKDKGIEINSDSPYELLLSISKHKFPEDFKSSKEEIVGWTHEIIDEVWSSLSKEQRLGWAEAFRDLILNPEKHFKTGILEPSDLNLKEFIELRKYVLTKKVDELV